jgi:thiol-disulfide isomerase/thioredoxin
MQHAAAPARTWRTLILALGAALAAGPDGAAAADGELPRYGFAPGQHLVYEGGESVVVSGTTMGVERRTELWVAAGGPAEGWTLVVRQQHARYTERQGARQELHRRSDAYLVDVSPQGVIPQRSLDSFDVLNRMLPALPRDAQEAAAGWSYSGAGVHHACGGLRREAGAAGPRLVFEVAPRSLRDDLSGFSSTMVYEIDPERGLVERVSARFFHEGRPTRSGGDRLVEVSVLPEAERQRLHADARRCMEAERAARRLTSRALGSCIPAEARRLLEEAGAGLAAARTVVETPLLRDRLDELIAQHRQGTPSMLSRATRQAALLNRPAPPWSLIDLAGATHTIDDLRGRVVVMDFWYRRCGWCLRAMPLVAELADRFTGRPVAVLGINTDDDPADARFVTDRARPPHPTLLADGALAASYQVSSYPTLVVLDRAGRVRHIEVGYTPTLVEDLGAVIEALLAEPG